MRSWVKNVACMLLMAWSLVTSQCVFCPGMQAAQPSPHDCCKPPANDHCGAGQSSKQCTGHSAAFESSLRVEAAPPLAVASAQLPPQSAEAATSVSPLPLDGDCHHPPPDRCLLNSVLLI
jgi:hypothetical protein